MSAAFPTSADEDELAVKRDQLKNRVYECLMAGKCLADAKEIHTLNREVNDMIVSAKAPESEV